jgi:outer membrane murein-binding lipoprotein Lpp
MKRVLGLVAVSLLFAGCATNSGVREQMGPLEKRVEKIEQDHASMNSKLDAINKKQDAQASDLQAMRKEMTDSGGSGQKAQQAAQDAQAAAQRAEAAAEKATKAFELRQGKGKR